MARLPSPRAKVRPRLEIIPFIDIMFFLLATFMILSLTMIENKGIAVNLPKASSSATLDRKEEVALTVTDNGALYWNKDQIPVESLPGRLQSLKASQPDPRIFIKGDEKAEFGKAIAVLDAVRLAGITRVAIETGKPEEQRPKP
jgi:biopolymer transport protein ExbD